MCSSYLCASLPSTHTHTHNTHKKHKHEDGKWRTCIKRSTPTTTTTHSVYLFRLRVRRYFYHIQCIPGNAFQILQSIRRLKLGTHWMQHLYVQCTYIYWAWGAERRATVEEVSHCGRHSSACNKLIVKVTNPMLPTNVFIFSPIENDCRSEECVATKIEIEIPAMWFFFDKKKKENDRPLTYRNHVPGVHSQKTKYVKMHMYSRIYWVLCVVSTLPCLPFTNQYSFTIYSIFSSRFIFFSAHSWQLHKYIIKNLSFLQAKEKKNLFEHASVVER